MNYYIAHRRRLALRFLSLIIGLCLAFCVSAQTTQPTPVKSAFEPVPTLPITGSLNINYLTRKSPGSEAIADVYTMQISVANSAVFKGTIAHLPYLRNKVTRNQPGRVTYDMELFVLNPNVAAPSLDNPAHAKGVGKIFGFAPIDENNVYHYSDGGIKVAVFPGGRAGGFESSFKGIAAAKPPAASGLAKIKKEAVRLVSSKGGAIVLTNYDKMTFDGHVLPAGPVASYPETTVTGTLFYDYGRSAWHFNNVTFLYTAEGRKAADILTGSIRWIEPKNRKATGEGHYEFDIRVNEPPPSESQIFSAPADEASFFATDDSMPALTGSVNYKDTFSGETVVASAVQIALKTTKLSKQQAMMLTKLIFFSAIVPFNAE